MDDEIIIEKMKQLAEKIDYVPEDITYLSKAMFVNVLYNGNTSNKEYFNGSLATLGDTILKMIKTEKLYRLGGSVRGPWNVTINSENFNQGGVVQPLDRSAHVRTRDYS